MTHAELGRLQKRVAKYVFQLRDTMWLGLWAITIKVEDNPDGEDSLYARIVPADSQHIARLSIATEVADKGGDELRQTVVHELIHLYLRDATDVIRFSLPKELSNSAYIMLWEAFRQQIELAVDDMANAWAKWLPLPAWPAD